MKLEANIYISRSKIQFCETIIVGKGLASPEKYKVIYLHGS